MRPHNPTGMSNVPVRLEAVLLKVCIREITATRQQLKKRIIYGWRRLRDDQWARKIDLRFNINGLEFSMESG